MIDSKYFSEYRSKLGFTNQNIAKSFFSAKDIIPAIDYRYIDKLNNRLYEIIIRIDSLVCEDIKSKNIELFCEENISKAFSELRKYKIISKLNNQGRRPEEVYFSWMRGFVVSSYFVNAISIIFDTDIDSVKVVGDDDWKNIKTFRRTPKADLEVETKDLKKYRIEIQSGFQGINDIKQHKVIQAKMVYRNNSIESVLIHFDIFNGQVAFVKLNKIKENDINWITRQQMEGQTVFNIDQNYFVWKLLDSPPKFNTILV